MTQSHILSIHEQQECKGIRMMLACSLTVSLNMVWLAVQDSMDNSVVEDSPLVWWCKWWSSISNTSVSSETTLTGEDSAKASCTTRHAMMTSAYSWLMAVCCMPTPTWIGFWSGSVTITFLSEEIHIKDRQVTIIWMNCFFWQAH